MSLERWVGKNELRERLGGMKEWNKQKEDILNSNISVPIFKSTGGKKKFLK